jgi:ribosomal protein S6
LLDSAHMVTNIKEQKDESTQVYEVGYHVISSIPEEEVGAHVAQVHDMIEKAGGVIIGEEFPKTMELAYPMVKVAQNQRKTYTSAYFGWVKFEGPTASAPKVKKDLDQDEKILRFIIVKTVRENTMIPKKVALQAGRRDDDESPRERSKPAPEKEKPMTEEELDKTIDELAPVEVPKPALK